MSNAQQKDWVNKIRDWWPATVVGLVIGALITGVTTWQLDIYGNRYDAIQAELRDIEINNQELLKKLTEATNQGFDGVAVYAQVKEVIPSIDKQYLQIARIEKYLPSTERATLEGYQLALLNLKSSVKAANDPVSFGPVYEGVQKVLTYHDKVVNSLYSRAGLEPMVRID